MLQSNLAEYRGWQIFMQIRQRIFKCFSMQICRLFFTAFWNFWRITRLSTTNHRWVINAQTSPVFFGPPCIYGSCADVCSDDFTSANQLFRQHKEIYKHVIDTINSNCHRINQVDLISLLILRWYFIIVFLDFVCDIACNIPLLANSLIVLKFVVFSLCFLSSVL